uniref:Geranylgeranyl transferase type-2 subunit alpha n=1 Tax=Neolamprologus brichardi TaxID=32507 RepID=A0A3Q4GHR3_NEOBR
QHGRVKIKTTAQQEEEKRKEREKKLKIYVAARDACFSKRNEGIWDDEALQLTQQLLSSNPDFATLWNYRREILMHLETVKDKDEVQKIYEAELLFTESCLKVNPKSYGSWHHRGWVSARLPRPDWARELTLCDRCLSLDDRNFHCWDYRRMVVKMSGVPVDQELAFTDRLIGSNFSNYSSWHYRSTLLPLLHPESPEPPSPCREPPQSSPPPSPQTHSHRAQSVGLFLVLDGQPQRVEWRSVHPRFKQSPVWVSFSIFDVAGDKGLIQPLTASFASAGCLLTIILLMRALDPLGYEQEMLAHFRTLKEVDSMRSAYYSDLCSKFMIENTILKMEYAEVRVFSISDKNLTTLCHLDQLLLVTHINLSSNHLQRLPPQFAMLQCLEVLEADNNAIENLEGVYHLPKLEEVLLKNNKISTLADLQTLASCPKLKRLDLRGNPVTQTANVESELAELLPSVTDLLL